MSISHDADPPRMSLERERDEDRLAELGYKQELRRDWGLMHNFGISFSIIVSGVRIHLQSIAIWEEGREGTRIRKCRIKDACKREIERRISVLDEIEYMSLIRSISPQASESVITGITTLFQYGLNTGGPGVMSVGWIVVSVFTFIVGLGMAEIVSAIPTSGGPYFWAAMLAPPNHAPFASWITGWFNLLGQVAVTTGITFGLANLISTTATVKGSYSPSAGKTLGIYAALLISHGTVNTFGVRILRFLNNNSIIFHSLGVFSLGVAVLAKAPTHQSAKFVFATFYDGTAVAPAVGWSIRASPAYVAACGSLLTQYTLTGFDASAHLSEETHRAAWSAPRGVIMSVGISAIFGFFILLSFLFSIQDFDNTVGSSYAQPVLQILVDVFVWLAAFLSFCLALPSLGSSVAFAAATSIATIGLYVSYGIPILIGVLHHRAFAAIKGPFNLGGLSAPVAVIAVLWIGFISVVFCLPTANPVTSQTLNYTAVAVGIILVGALGSWVLWARRWFTGPIRQIEAERRGIDIDAPGELERAEADGKL
ncbi:hypothetical protein MMC06_000670 [Schaereria dolodes]|nr:hypothetical protein [Schaereria dolodes]